MQIAITFTIAQSGRFELSSHGLTVGQWYYLSSAAAGGLVTTEPTISQPIVYVESASFIYVYQYRPTNLLINSHWSNVPGDSTVTSAKIVNGTIVADDLADDAVTTAKIADDAITSALIADDAVGAAAIADNAVDIARLNVSDGNQMDRYYKQMEMAHSLSQILLVVEQAWVKPSLWDNYNGS